MFRYLHEEDIRTVELLAEHLEWLADRGLAAGTIQARGRAVKRLVRRLRAPLLEASREDLLAWRRALCGGPKTIATEVSHAHQFCLWLVVMGYRRDDPAEGLPFPRRPRTLPRPIAERDLMRALDGAPGRIHALSAERGRPAASSHSR